MVAKPFPTSCVGRKGTACAGSHFPFSHSSLLPSKWPMWDLNQFYHKSEATILNKAIRRNGGVFVSGELWLLRNLQATWGDSKHKITDNNEVAFCAK